MGGAPISLLIAVLGQESLATLPSPAAKTILSVPAEL